jgi:hypothetical protein
VNFDCPEAGSKALGDPFASAAVEHIAGTNPTASPSSRRYIAQAPLNAKVELEPAQPAP